MIRVVSQIGDKRVPLQYEFVRTPKTLTVALTSQCMQVSPAAPLAIYADEDVTELVRALRDTGYWRIEVFQEVQSP